MSKNYEEAFQGTREAARTAAAEIHNNMQRYSKTGHKDAPKHQLLHGLSVLRNICVAANSTQGKHHDIYCDILEQTLAPYMQPTVNADIWSRILEFLRYFHYLMMNGKHYLEAERVFTLLTNQKELLQNEADYKYVLSTYCQHLLLQRGHLQDATAGKQQISKVLQALNTLFSSMQQANVELNFCYTNLINDFVSSLMPKRSAAVFTFLASLPQIAEMFERFFALLAALKLPQPSAAEVCLQAQQHLEALHAFLQFDMKDKLQQKLALQHLRVCRDLKLWQQDKGLAHSFTLLYYYIKLLYAPTQAKDFARIYMDLSGKFISFFTKSGEALVQHSWFVDLLALMQSLFTHMQQYPGALEPFDACWQQLNNVDGYLAHLQLLLAVIKLAPAIKDTKLVSWTCCSSTRKHVILALALSALTAYASFMPHALQAEEQAAKALMELQQTFTSILRYAVRVIDSLSCINAKSSELKMFYARFAQLTREICTPGQALYCASTLATEIAPLREKFALSDWTILLRRLYKTARQAQPASLACDIMSCYVAALLQEQSDCQVLRNQIGVYYSTPPSVLDKCLLQLYEESRNVLRPLLEKQQRRLLLWLETQHFSKYERVNTVLHTSLLRCTQTPQDFMFVVKACKLHTEATLIEVQNVCKELNVRRLKGQQLRRVEQLVLAQASATLLHVETDLEKRKIVSVEGSDCKEDTLEQLMQRKEMCAVNINNEMRLINLARDAVCAYETFYFQVSQRGDAKIWFSPSGKVSRVYMNYI